MKDKKLRRPITKEQHEYMKDRQNQNLESCINSKAESWANSRLKETGIKWNRQAQWGYRLFDFWNDKLGIAVEVDGKEHNPNYDKYRDDYNFKRSAILVLRVRNFNDQDMDSAISLINTSDTWIERRIQMKLLTKAQKLKLSTDADSK